MEQLKWQFLEINLFVANEPSRSGRRPNSSEGLTIIGVHLLGVLRSNHHLKRCISAFFNKCIRVEASCFDLSTGTFLSKCPINTC